MKRLLRILNQLPAKGELNIPTASSIHNSIKTSKKAMRYNTKRFLSLTNLISAEIPKPKMNNRTPETIKSKRLHCTSLVNCIVISGILNSIVVTRNMYLRCFFRRCFLWFPFNRVASCIFIDYDRDVLLL